jgi:urea transport system permease protein
VQFPSTWQYVLGALFVAVIVWAPRGLAGLLADGRDAVLRRFVRQPAAALADPPDAVRATAPTPGPVKVGDPT